MFLIPTLNDILKLDVLPENIRCYEDRCPAGLDPASFTKKYYKKKPGKQCLPVILSNRPW